jgi:MraZ protein
MERQGETTLSPLPEYSWDFNFNGQYENAVDAKGRISIPVPFRKLDDGREITRFKLTLGLDDCLFLFPLDYWRQEVEPQLKRLPVMEAGARKLFRMFVTNAIDCKPDKQGRIIIPSRLRDKRGINSEVIVAGAIDRIEIWPVEGYDDYELSDVKEVEDIAKQYDINF